MFKACWSVIERELLSASRRKSDILNPIWFFLIVITLFPLSIGPKANTLTSIAPGVIWVAALLSCLLSLERLFKDDYVDGSLEQLMLTPYPLTLLVAAKVLAHWLLTCLPIILFSPLMAVFFSLDWPTFWAIALTLLLGTPTICLLGAIGVALTVGLRKGGILLSLIMLPLSIPVLIISTLAIDAASMSQPNIAYLAMLGAILVAAITLAPMAIAVSLRISMS
ncbi:heme exporter protein CcmB [Motilimonas pumila]|uniref:Heme exporter protein B n=1 Tax=Motilimonas pumila TaxID=2303987 RepID=A0A418YGR4_9GAMM|nr:heme exporter protein CcmB [Motilimonas pumila]RJG49048.1 heme exporter protein CcmB [Motilimonas pumila]